MPPLQLLEPPLPPPPRTMRPSGDSGDGDSTRGGAPIAVGALHQQAAAAGALLSAYGSMAELGSAGRTGSGGQTAGAGSSLAGGSDLSNDDGANSSSSSDEDQGTYNEERRMHSSPMHRSSAAHGAGLFTAQRTTSLVGGTALMPMDSDTRLDFS